MVVPAPEKLDGEVHACIRAENVRLERGDRDQRQAPNRLEAVIVSLVQEGPMVRVGLECGFPLVALIPRQAWDELALRQIDRVRSQAWE